MSVEADVCNYCKFVFDMARFTYTSINYTRGTSLRSEVPLVFVCSKSSTRVDGYNAPLKVGGSISREIKVSGSALAAEICAGPHNRLFRRQHCSSLCSQSEGHEHVANMTNALGHDFVGFSTRAWPPQYSPPSLCEQSEGHEHVANMSNALAHDVVGFLALLGRNNIRPPHFASKVSYSASPQIFVACSGSASCCYATCYFT